MFLPFIATIDKTEADLSSINTRFDKAHEHAYAHSLPTYPAEIVNLRLRLLGVTEKPKISAETAANSTLAAAQKGTRPIYFGNTKVDTPVYDRTQLQAGHQFEGPAVVEEWTSTILIRPRQAVRIDPFGNLCISRGA